MIQDFSATLTKKKEIAPHVWYYHFSLPEGVTMDFTAGQYVILKIGENYRQYSIASRDTWRDTFELLVEIVPQGLGSSFFYNLEVGGKAQFKGPAGVFTLKETQNNKVFLATGTGVAPMKSMIESYYEKNIQSEVRLALFFGVKTRAEIYLYEEMKKYVEAHPHFSYYACLSQEPSLDGLDAAHCCLGRINAHLEQYVRELGDLAADTEYYICGSKQVVDSLKEFVTSLGAPQEKIYFERFTL